MKNIILPLFILILTSCGGESIPTHKSHKKLIDQMKELQNIK